MLQGRLPGKDFSYVYLTDMLSSDQSRSLVTMINYSDMIRHEVNFVLKQIQEKNDLIVPNKFALQQADLDSQKQARRRFVPLINKIKNQCLQLNKYCEVVMRESSLCKLLLSSQISHAQLAIDKLSTYLERIDRQLSDEILQFLGIFHSFSQSSNMPDFEVIEANYIPRWACVDWKLYKEILVHILLH